MQRETCFPEVSKEKHTSADKILFAQLYTQTRNACQLSSPCNLHSCLVAIAQKCASSRNENKHNLLKIVYFAPELQNSPLSARMKTFLRRLQRFQDRAEERTTFHGKSPRGFPLQKHVLMNSRKDRTDGVLAHF